MGEIPQPSQIYTKVRPGKIYMPSALAIAEEQMKKNVDILKSLFIGAGTFFLVLLAIT